MIEKQARGQPPYERQRLRSTQAKPILERLHTWLQTTLRTLSKGSPLSKAIHYALKQWDALVAYTDNGYAEIDNNSAERSLRPIALQEKLLVCGFSRRRRTSSHTLFDTRHRQTERYQPE